MLELLPVAPEQRQLLWNVNQKYLYEMTNYYDDEMDDNGNCSYGHFDAYFSDPLREALFIAWDGKIAGFAFINPYSNTGCAPDHVLAEFTVFPAFRRRHIALEAARLIFERRPGAWEIKYNENNLPAKKLWHKASAPYKPSKLRLNEVETVLVFDTRIAGAPEAVSEGAVIEERAPDEALMSELIRLSQAWENENSCHGYRKNSKSDIEGNRIFVASYNSEIAGYLFGHMEKAERTTSIMPAGAPFFEVEELYVKPEYRSCGIGKKLFCRMEKAVSGEAEYIMLSTATKNSRAILHFYLDELDMTFWSARLFKKLSCGAKEPALLADMPKMDESDQPLKIRYAEKADLGFWFSLDRHISENEFIQKVERRMSYIIEAENEPVGLLRYSLFWDSIPFCNLLYIKDGKQRQGYGRALVEYWEKDMKSRGFDLVMTSTQSNESAQHFYRALGYRDCGGFTLPFEGYEQPAELMLAKKI